MTSASETSAATTRIRKSPLPTSTSSPHRACVSPTPTAPPASAHPRVTPCSPAATTGETSTASSTPSENRCSNPGASPSQKCSRPRDTRPPASENGTSAGIGTRSASPDRRKTPSASMISIGRNPSPTARSPTASTTTSAIPSSIFHPTAGSRTTRCSHLQTP